MMAYCPECGSEVAPNNTFCAYCGIALEAAPAVEEKISQPEMPAMPPVLNEPINEVLPEISPVKADNAVFDSEVNEPNPTVDPLPPTPFILESDANAITQTDPGIVPAEAPPEINKNTVENWSAKTDSSFLNNISQDLLESIPPVIEAPVSSELVLETEIPKKDETFDLHLTEEPNFGEKFEDAVLPENPVSFPSAELPVLTDPVEKPVSYSSEAFSNSPINYPETAISKPLTELPIPEDEMGFAETIPYSPQQAVSSNVSGQHASAFEKTDEFAKPEIDDDLKTTEVFSSEEFLKSLELPAESNFVENNVIPTAANLSPVNAELPADLPPVSAPLPVQTEAVTLLGYDSSKLELDAPKTSEPPAAPVAESTPFIPEISNPLPPFETPVETPSAPAVVITPPISQEIPESKENRPFTNHNIGVVDTDGNKSAKLKPLEEGTILNNRYEIMRKIGGGGMGAVYLANDRNLGDVLRAVKEMVQSSIEDEQQEKAITDFKRESTILSALEHPAIPTIFDYFFDEKEGRFYLVMKYISGGDLAARLRAAPEGKIDEATITEWGIQLADVLHYLHKQEPQIVYRDLKPSNIMIDGNTGRIMLIDFGIARLINSDNSDVTAVGTMGYAPPELYRKNVEARSDIFSLGATMFHLLTGADPQSNPLLIFDFNKNPRPRQINSLISDQMEQILMRSTELDCVNRFSSAAEMRDALKTHLDNLLKGSVTHGVVSDSGKAAAHAGNLPVFCGFCGQKIVATDQFCPFCGSLQPTAGQSNKLPQSPVYSAPKVTARVLVVGTNDLGTPEFSLDKDTNLVGRRDPMSNIFPEVDLSKYDPQTKISRKHARIWRENDAFMLEDLGSSNGTVLMSAMNEPVRLLPRQAHALANGDKIKVGDTTLHFFVG